MKVILYTTHCPQCTVLERMLVEKGIEYTECTDMVLMIEKGFQTAPQLEVDGVVMGFPHAISWIKSV